ncbi:HdeD family acid-resistance protein [Actinoplanes sp. NPDC051494]|uniref:HdeD family acid-resistance protein n=1 Tax=Actinoplanes sp. NPDC051494 TaxID=3363907 RepID=UPI00378D39DB
MLWSGSSPLTVVRDGMWGFLLFAGVAWLAVAWSVLRLEPADIAQVAGPVILFAAVTEAVRALAGTRTWWLNAGMTVLFAATGAILITDGDTSSWTTPAALIGWYLMVRGAADLAIAMLTRESDRIWGLLTVVGVTEVALGFFAAGSYARTAELVVVILGGAALIRGVADLVASLRLREASAGTRAQHLLELPPERAIGVAGYTAGMADFDDAPQRGTTPRHRAAAPSRPSAAGMADLARPSGTSDRAVPLDTGATGMPVPHVTATQIGAGPGPTGSFHDEVVRTTADLDAMLALAGVTGAAAPGTAARAAADQARQVEIPDTAEGAELPDPAQASAAAAAAQAAALAAANASASGHTPASLPLLDPAGRAAEAAGPGMDDTSIIMRSRMVD